MNRSTEFGLIQSIGSIFVFIFYFVLYTSVVLAVGPMQSDWSRLDLAKFTNNWSSRKDGDIFQEVEQTRREQAKLHMDKIMHGNSHRLSDRNQANESLTMTQYTGPPVMIFTKLAKSSNISEWDWDELANICDGWANRLDLKMIVILCYPMEPDSILVTVPRGIDGGAVFQYLSMQEILSEVKWNDTLIHPNKRKKTEEGNL